MTAFKIAVFVYISFSTSTSWREVLSPSANERTVRFCSICAAAIPGIQKKAVFLCRNQE